MTKKEINKVAHSYNLPRIPFFKRCVIGAVFMFKVNLFQIFG